jgi:plasmid maintenance system antidote protein VapI
MVKVSIIKNKMKGNNMCSLMDITEDKVNTIVKEEPVTWSWAVDILERHIVHKEYISSTSLLTALERIKCG